MYTSNINKKLKSIDRAIQLLFDGVEGDESVSINSCLKCNIVLKLEDDYIWGGRNPIKRRDFLLQKLGE